MVSTATWVSMSMASACSTTAFGNGSGAESMREGGTNREYSGSLTKSIRGEVRVLLQVLPTEVIEESRTLFCLFFLAFFFFPMESAGSDLRLSLTGAVSITIVGDSTAVED